MVDFLPDEEQELVIRSAREFLEAELPVSRFGPAAKNQRTESQLWKRFADLGWFGTGLPEEAGGIGYTIAEEALLFRECGRFLVSESLLGTALAARVAAATGDRDRLQALLDGALRAGIAVASEARAPRQEVEGTYYRLGHAPGQLMVIWNEAGMGLYDDGVVRDAVAGEPLDESSTVDRVTLSGKPLAWVPAAAEDLPIRAGLLLSAELAGLCEGSCEMAVAYAKLREQFGQAIGAFQAIKHRCADMRVRAEAAWCQTVLATLAWREGQEGARLQVRAAQLLSADSAIRNGAANIQIHGGIGYTSDCPAHLFLKKAHVLDLLSGGARLMRAEILSRAGVPDQRRRAA